MSLQKAQSFTSKAREIQNFLKTCVGIVQQLKNNVTQLAIAMTLGISPSTAYYIRESGEMSTCKDQNQDAHYVQSLRRDSIEKQHDSVKAVTTWASETLWKTIVSKHPWIYKCKLRLYHVLYISNIQKRLHGFWARAHLRRTASKVKKPPLV